MAGDKKNVIAAQPPTGAPPSYEAAAIEHGDLPERNALTTKPAPRGVFPLDIPVLNQLRGKRIILASQSPRRKQIISAVLASPKPNLDRPNVLLRFSPNSRSLLLKNPKTSPKRPSPLRIRPPNRHHEMSRRLPSRFRKQHGIYPRPLPRHRRRHRNRDHARTYIGETKIAKRPYRHAEDAARSKSP